MEILGLDYGYPRKITYLFTIPLLSGSQFLKAPLMS